MQKKHAMLDAVSAGTIAFLAMYAAPKLAALPVFWYLPLSRVWVFTSKPAEMGMAWYGQTLFAVVAGLVTGGLVYLLSRNAAPSAAKIRIFAGLIAAGFLAVAAVHVHEVTGRVLSPEPLPSWYVPK